jgi:hypothetical protein
MLLCKSPSLWGDCDGNGEICPGQVVSQCPNRMAVPSAIPDFDVSALISPVTIMKTAVARNLRIEKVGRNEVEDFRKRVPLGGAPANGSPL